MSATIHTVNIQFPEIALAPRDAHKLRGYLGRLFQDHSPLLHNHLEGGGLRYGYPLVQYKVLNKVPTLVGLAEGAQLLTELFLKIQEIRLEDAVYPVMSKNIQSATPEIGVSDELFTYQFQTLWMALNQENYRRYQRLAPPGQTALLRRIVTGNVLSFFKGIGVFLTKEERILVQLQVQPRQTQFKNQPMLAFQGKLTTNVALPESIGIGKAVSRGFGTLRRIM
ncbi:CRISPR-associated endonuclease Cas6 [Tunicatimonas pelagia]|uniref:CRISPR-associated endonuclease Cas6 n=1 Tax=Tunicatimonas pelagia TaxID=931531 RepID=UPI0026663EAB|nr:CRISPR-associated endonuclease Cas6 [Tunicatimonas pelagia]WKN44265.1 CRISPR-associated endonuclease Cas6 [Tunicatimonas pelagia]